MYADQTSSRPLHKLHIKPGVVYDQLEILRLERIIHNDKHTRAPWR